MIDGTNYLINICIQELNFPEKDVEQLLVSLILDNRIQGHIDQVNKLLERGERCRAPNFSLILYCTLCGQIEMLICLACCRSKGMRKYNAIDKWNTQLKSIYQTLSNRV